MPSPDAFAGITFRRPDPADADAWAAFVLAEQARTYSLPPSFAHQERPGVIANLQASFDDPARCNAVVAESLGRLVGLASTGPGPSAWEIDLGLVPAPADRELDKLYVLPDWQGTGLAARLFDAVMDDRPHYLWLIDGNARAARFYERRGFVHLDERFETGEDWGGLTMHRMLRTGRPA